MAPRPGSATARTAGVAAVAVAASYLGVRTRGTDPLDRAVHRLVHRPAGRVADQVIGVLTDLGSVYGAAGAATALAVTGRTGAAARVVTATALAWSAAQAAKPLLARPRPYEQGGAARLVAVPAGSSWPSGHAAVACAVVTALAPELSAPGRAAATAAAVEVGLSRCYVGVHHASDVVAGAGVGVLAGLAARPVVRAVRTRSAAGTARAAASAS